MFNAKTVFILGAGSSREVGLPIAGELGEKIATLLDIRFVDGFRQASGDVLIWEAYRRKDSAHANDYRAAGCAIKSGIVLANSIDNFLDNHRDNPQINLCGKLGIVRAISEAERASLLFLEPSWRDGPITVKNISDTWFVKFFRMLSERVAKSELERLFENIAFINFNYDRCLEHFLVHAVRDKYGLDRSSAHSVMKNLVVHHPYGNIGLLQWQNENQWTPFGVEVEHPDSLLSMADRIRTFTEEVADAARLSELRKLVAEARHLVFLGFAFHPRNLELLKPESVVAPKRIYGTVRGVSASDQGVINEALRKLLGGPKINLVQEMNLLDVTCASLFDTYSRSLTQA
jgi:hypothetical protein